MWHSGYTCGGLWGHLLDDSGHTHEMYLQQRDQLPDKQVSNRRAKKTFVCHYLSHLLTFIPTFSLAPMMCMSMGYLKPPNLSLNVFTLSYFTMTWFSNSPPLTAAYRR